MNFAPGIADSAWIGLTDERLEGQFEWVTGEPIGYTNWAIHEPNSLGNEDYGQYWNVLDLGGFSWNDSENIPANAENGRLVGYIVEFDGPFIQAVPEPTSLTLFVVIGALGSCVAGFKRRPMIPSAKMTQ